MGCIACGRKITEVGYKQIGEWGGGEGNRSEYRIGGGVIERSRRILDHRGAHGHATYAERRAERQIRKKGDSGWRRSWMQCG